MQVSVSAAQNQALVSYIFDEEAERAPNEYLDLQGATVTAVVGFDAALAGPNFAPSSISLAFQSAGLPNTPCPPGVPGRCWLWAETPWRNLVPGSVLTLSSASVANSNLPADWDWSRIRSVVVKYGRNTGGGAFALTGNVYIDSISVDNGAFSTFTFNDGATRTQLEVEDARNSGLHVIRHWVFGDGRGGLVYDSSGLVTGLDDRVFADLREALRIAELEDVYLVPVLFDFLIGARPVIVNGVQTFGRSHLLTDPTARASLINNAIVPLFQEFGNERRIVLWDLMNEPEWLLTNELAYVVIPPGRRPAEIAPGGVISFAAMVEFLSAIRWAYPGHIPGYSQGFTLGGASHQWMSLWANATPSLGLDVLQFHLWNGIGQIDEGVTFAQLSPFPNVPTVLGEFDADADCGLLLNDALARGFSGVWAWSYRAKDNVSAPLLGASCRTAYANFMVAHPELIPICP